MNASPNYDELDPGIRHVVRLLRSYGFETTDSGDGVSKRTALDDLDPFDREVWLITDGVLPFPHVAASTDVREMVSEAERMAEVLGEPWVVEASYSTASRSAILFARHAVEGELQ